MMRGPRPPRRGGPGGFRGPGGPRGGRPPFGGGRRPFGGPRRMGGPMGGGGMPPPPPPGRPPRYRGGCLGCLLPVLGLSFSLVLALVLLICLL